jgi:hypothetical protein
MKFGPGISAIHFSEAPIPRSMGAYRDECIAIADLNPLPRNGEAPPPGFPRWKARKYENAQDFRDRITGELKAAGCFGECVFVYTQVGFWQKNIRGEV